LSKRLETIRVCLQVLFGELEVLTQELAPYDGVLRACGGRPLAECGASDKIRIAVSILNAAGIDIPNGKET